jgi:hypothetical protein
MATGEAGAFVIKPPARVVLCPEQGYLCRQSTLIEAAPQEARVCISNEERSDV